MLFLSFEFEICEPLAQSVEQQPFKLWVVGSIPTRLTMLRPHRLAWSRTPPFHGENRGSNPLGDAKIVDPNFLGSNQTVYERRRAHNHLVLVSSEVQG